MTTRIATALLAALALLAAGATARAQTADGLTPAEETVCDHYQGSSRLFGLCNSYCEAMDCDIKPPGEPHADETACVRVREQFKRHSGGVELTCTAGAPLDCFGQYTADLERCDFAYDECTSAFGDDQEAAFDACYPAQVECEEAANTAFFGCGSV